MTNMGIVGLGRMGCAVAQRLIGEGHHVVGCDARDVTVEGVGIKANIAQVARDSDIILTLVTDDAAEGAVFCAPGGLLSTDLSGKLIIQMTTVRPDTVRRLASLVAGRGGHVVDAPCMGSIPQAAGGTLKFLVGGDEADVAVALPILSALGQKTTHLGPLGSGMAMKLAVNIGLAAYILAIGEGLAMGEREGLDVTQMVSVLADGPITTRWLSLKADVLAGAPSPITLDIASLRNDLAAAVITAERQGLSLPLSTGGLASYDAAVERGWGSLDDSELPSFIRHPVDRI